MKIYLVDNANNGHHDIYQKTLNKIQNTVILNKICRFNDVKKNPIKAYKERSKFITYINNNTQNGDLIHFLYLDSIYKCPFISNKLKYNKKYIGTLHWIPNDIFRKTLLKKISKRIECIVVHSEFLKEELIKMGINNVKCIDYPSFIKREVNKYDDSVQKNKIIISCLGGTRLDKGLDVLIEAFKYLDDVCKNKIIFNICGVEQDIKYKDIIKKSEENSINIIYKNKFLSDEEYEEEIFKTDIILLPYKKIFTGNSGPMTDGIYADKFILGPNHGNLGYLIKKYDLGETFEQEDPVDLANKISSLSKIDLNKSHKYKEKLKIETFITLYEKVYNDIIKVSKSGCVTENYGG